LKKVLLSFLCILIFGSVSCESPTTTHASDQYQKLELPQQLNQDVSETSSCESQYKTQVNGQNIQIIFHKSSK